MKCYSCGRVGTRQFKVLTAPEYDIRLTVCAAEKACRLRMWRRVPRHVRAAYRLALELML